MQFLVFRLYAPLSSFGDVAVGERRPSLLAPTRSMVLGVLAACLGLPRDAEADQSELERLMGVATRTDATGELLVDYHTAQAPDAPRVSAWRKRWGRPPATRREELSATFDRNDRPHALDTQLGQRQYRADAAFAVCVWLREASERPSLARIAEKLREPEFVPYAGRKGAAIAMPFEPGLVEASDPVAALRAARFELDGLLDPLTSRVRLRTYRWEGIWEGLQPQRTEVRRDRLASRRRWQFLTREEHVLAEEWGREDADVLDAP